MTLGIYRLKRGPCVNAVTCTAMIAWAAAPVCAQDATARAAEVSRIEKAQTEVTTGEPAQADEAKQDQAARLIEYGITAGVAFAVQTPFVNADGTQQKGVSTVALPYIMLVPGYWAASEENRRYCASNWAFGSTQRAQDAASASARQFARRLVDWALAYAKPDPGSSTLKAEVSAHWCDALGIREVDCKNKCRMTNSGAKDACTARCLATNEATAYKRAEVEAQAKALVTYVTSGQAGIASIVESLADLRWNRAYPGRCGGKKIGLWVGFPASYDVRTKISGTVQEAKFEPSVAFGLAFVPNSFISLLAGVTVGEVGDPDSSKADHTIWAFTLGLGGNADVITQFLTK